MEEEGKLMSDPAVVKKWLPRHVRQTIKNYRPEYFSARTYLTDSGVWIEHINHGNEAWAWLTFAFQPVRIVEQLNLEFQNTASDWSELVEVAAWTIQLDDPNHIALAKQVASELVGMYSSCLFLQHDNCTSYHKEGRQLHPLRQIPFS